MKIQGFVVAAFVALAVSACGPSKQDVAVKFANLNSTMSGFQSAARQAEVLGEFTFDCAKSGTATFKLAAEGEQTGANSGSASISYSIVFNACESDDGVTVTSDGPVVLTFGFEGSANDEGTAGSFGVAIGYNGKFTVTGGEDAGVYEANNLKVTTSIDFSGLGSLGTTSVRGKVVVTGSATYNGVAYSYNNEEFSFDYNG